MNANSNFFNIFSKILENYIDNIDGNVLVGFSGGPDSTALLLGLKFFFKNKSKRIIALHLNHLIEKNSDFYEEESRKICKELSVDFFSHKIDIPKIAKKEKISIELAGRNARYDFFQSMAKKYHTDIILLGHTMDDQAETVIHNSIRGSGLAGISGMKILSKNRFLKVLRPMLDIRKFECIKYCETNNVKPLIDLSNQKKIYTRNKIRLSVIPELNKVSIRSIENISKLSKNLSSEIKILDWITEKYYKKIITDKKNTYKRDVLNKLPIELTAKIMMKIWATNYSHKGSLDKKHIIKISNLIYKNSGKKVYLPGKIILYFDKKTFAFLENRNNSKIKKIITKKYTKLNYLKSEETITTSLPNTKYSISAKLEKCPSNFPPSNKLVIYISTNVSLDLIKLRTITRKDVFRPLGMKEEINAYNFLKKQNIPDRHREEILVLENEKGIIWIVGLRIAEWAKVKKFDSNATKLSLTYLK